MRKQSDTGKTPAEMYKEIYGREPPINQQEPGNKINVEGNKDVEVDCTEEDITEMRVGFEEDFWPAIKQEVKDMTKKEACFTSFLLGFETMKAITKKEFKTAVKLVSEMSPEELRKMLENSEKNHKNKNKSKNYMHAVQK